MSIKTLAYLYCDIPECERCGEPYTNAADVHLKGADQRILASVKGWRRTEYYGRLVDACPECMEKLRLKRKELLYGKTATQS